MEGSRVPKGRIKWFNANKGYGFIAPEDCGEDVLIHVSAIEQDQLSSLDEGLDIYYEAEAGPRGMRATKIC
jgi:CspA family cold shock protein